MTEREAADRLNLMPNYVGILERDDYTSLRSPPFARGYVKAYGRMLGLHEETLMAVFDQTTVIAPIKNEKRKDTTAFAITTNRPRCCDRPRGAAAVGGFTVVVEGR